MKAAIKIFAKICPFIATAFLTLNHIGFGLFFLFITCVLILVYEFIDGSNNLQENVMDTRQKKSGPIESVGIGGLDVNHKLILKTLYSPEKGWFSINDIAEKTGLSFDEIENKLNSLIMFKLIQKEEGAVNFIFCLTQLGHSVLEAIEATGEIIPLASRS